MTASQFNTLKNACNKEWARRCYNGSMARYNTNPATAVAAGGLMLASQGNIIMTPFTKMKTHGNLATSSTGTAIQSNFDYSTINTWLNTLKARNRYSSTNDCNAACSGLCVGCQGCSASCKTDCSGCSGTCTGCSAACKTNCTGCSGCGGCDGSCSSCGGACSSNCSGCQGCGGCDGGCSSCGGACSSNCSGCQGCGGCDGNCSGCGPCTGCEGGPGCNSGCIINCAGCSGCRGYPTA